MAWCALSALGHSKTPRSNRCNQSAFAHLSEADWVAIHEILEANKPEFAALH